MENLPGVQSAVDLPGLAKTLNAGWNEGSPEVARPAAEPVGADPVGDLRADVERAAERRLQRDARHALHARPQGRDDRADRGRGQAVRGRATGTRTCRSSWRPATSGVMAATNEAVGGGAVADHGLRLRGGHRAVPDLVPVRARHAVHPDPAGPRVAAVLRADDRARDRAEGEHAAGGGARRRRRRGLRHLPLQPVPHLLPGGRLAARGVLQDARGDGQRRVLHRPDPGDRRWRPGSSRRSSSRPTWACCWRSCS